MWAQREVLARCTDWLHQHRQNTARETVAPMVLCVRQTLHTAIFGRHLCTSILSAQPNLEKVQLKALL